jgi:hypothetical protein
LAVDGHVVVVPAQRGEVVGIMVAAVATLPNVMGLKPIPALASVDGAALVSPGDGAPHRRRDRLGGIGGDDGVPAGKSDDLHRSGAQQLVEGGGADPRPEFDLGAELTAAAVGGVEIQDQGIRDSEIPPSEYYPEGYHPELLEEWPVEGDLVVPIEIAPELAEAMGENWRHRKAYEKHIAELGAEGTTED